MVLYLFTWSFFTNYYFQILYTMFKCINFLTFIKAIERLIFKNYFIFILDDPVSTLKLNKINLIYLKINENIKLLVLMKMLNKF